MAATTRTSGNWLPSSRLSHNHLRDLRHPFCRRLTRSARRTRWAARSSSSNGRIELGRVFQATLRPPHRSGRAPNSALLAPRLPPHPVLHRLLHRSDSLRVSPRRRLCGRRSLQSTAKSASEPRALTKPTAALIAHLNRSYPFVKQSNLLPLSSHQKQLYHICTVLFKKYSYSYTL